MRSKKNVDTLVLKQGETLEKKFNNYVDMATSAVDWTLFCTYQLKPNFSEGSYKILKLPSMQIAYTDMSGGVMFDYVVPEGCITFSVMQNITQKACIDQMKLKTGMIAITDDTKVYNFMCSSRVQLLDVSLNKDANPILLKKLRKIMDKYVIDGEGKMTLLLKSIVEEYTSKEDADINNLKQIEEQIIEMMFEILDTQEVKTPQFKKSEMVALEIKKKLFKHMDHKMSVSEIARNHNISEKSLQNSFKALFDLTPNQYIRILKLNLVHHELIQSNAAKTAVWKVAQKWGFSHMGRFSKYYKELFGENPSITLKTINSLPDGMSINCVERQEEILD
jgi:AraC-like DNA-binding protein